MAGGASIVVAGAGAFGSAITCALAEAGCRVLALDPAPRGDNASGVAAGMLAPAFETLFDDASARHFELLRDARDRWPALAGRLRLKLDRGGGVALGSAEEVASWADQLAEAGGEARRLSAAETGALSPAPRPDLLGLQSADEWRLSPLAALAALQSAARGAGAGFALGHVRDFATGALATGVGAKVAADYLVIATGASPTLAALAPELAMLTPVKGHLLRAANPFGAGPTLRTPGLYLCPTAPELILGATMETGLADTAIDVAVAADLQRRGVAAFPSLAEMAWRAAAGVRAACADGLPLVGHSRTPGVILAVGARRNGWLLAPLVAEIVADLIAGRPASRAARLFDPGRLTGPG